MSLNISFLNAVRAVAKDNTVVKVQGVSIDRQAAVAVMKVYDSLDEGMREKFMSRPVAQVVAIAKDLVRSFNTEMLSPVQKKIVAHRIPGMLVKAAEENTTLLGTVGIAIGTDSEDMLEASAEELGLVYADLDSDKVTKDSLELENRVARWLERKFGPVNLQGHASDDTLLGDMRIYRNMDMVEDSIDRQEPLRTSSGTLSLNDIPNLFDGLNYPDLYNDISVEFYDLQKEEAVTADKKSEQVFFDEFLGIDWELTSDNLKIFPDGGVRGTLKVSNDSEGYVGYVAFSYSDGNVETFDADNVPEFTEEVRTALEDSLAGFLKDYIPSKASVTASDRPKKLVESMAMSEVFDFLLEKIEDWDESTTWQWKQDNLGDIVTVFIYPDEQEAYVSIEDSRGHEIFYSSFDEDENTQDYAGVDYDPEEEFLNQKMRFGSPGYPMEFIPREIKYLENDGFEFTGDIPDIDDSTGHFFIIPEENLNEVYTTGESSWVAKDGAHMYLAGPYGSAKASLKLKKWNVIRDFGDHREVVGTVTTNFDSPKSVALDKAFFKYNNNSSSTIGFRLLVEEVKDGVYTAAKNLPAKGTPDWHEHKIAVDTVKNPAKAFLGGPSFKESVDTLKEKFGYSDADIAKLERGVTAARKDYDNDASLPNFTVEDFIEHEGKKYLVGEILDGSLNCTELGVENAPHERIVPNADTKIIGHLGEGITAAGVSTADLEDMIKRFNEAGSTFYLGEANGAFELWAKNSDGKDVRIESGSRKDIKEALIKNRYNEKYRVKASKKVEAGEYSKEKEKELRDLAKKAREKREAFKGDESSEEYKALDKDYDEKEHAYWRYVYKGKVEASRKVQADAMANDMKLGDWDAVIKDKTDSDGVYPTNRVIAEDPEFENPEFVELAYVDGVPVKITYRIPASEIDIVAETSDLASIDWESKINSIEVDLVSCDKEDIPDEKIAEVLNKYNPSEKEMKTKATADIDALYHKAGMTPPEGRGEHTKAFHELAINVAKGYIKKGESEKDALQKGYATAMKQLGDKALKSKASKRLTAKDKSDEDIAAEFDNMEIVKIDFNGDLNMPGRETLSGSIEAEFPEAGESVYGGQEGFANVSEQWLFYNFGEWKKDTEHVVEEFSFNHWYPDTVFNKMVEAIMEKIKAKLNLDTPDTVQEETDPTDIDTESLEVKSSERKYAPKPVNNKVYASTKVNEAVPQEVMDSYLEAALWTEEERFEEEDENRDSDIHTSFSDEFLERARQDLGKFFEDNKEAIEQFLVDEGQDLTQIAHSFWLTRNGHGAGFMDFGSDSAVALEEAADTFPSLDLFVGDDGLVYFSEGRPNSDFKRKAAKEIKSDADLSMDMFTFSVDDIEISDPSADFTLTLDGKVYDGRITTNRAYRGRGGELNLNSVDFDDPVAEETLGEDMLSFIGDFIADHLDEIFSGAPENEDDKVLDDAFDR